MNRRPLIYLLTTLFLLFSGWALRDLEWSGSQSMHTLMEALATLLALYVGSLALIRYFSGGEEQFLYIGAGFMGTAMLDGYHGLVTSSFFQSLMPSDSTTLVPWSWLASRLYLSILMVLSWFLWLVHRKKPNFRPNHNRVFLTVAATTLATFLFFAFVKLPLFTHKDWLFHRPFDLLCGIFFLIALIGYLYKGKWRSDSFEHWLVLSLIVGAMLQTSFMSVSASLYDFEFNVAHLLKKASYVLVLTGLMISLRETYALSNRFRLALDNIPAYIYMKDMQGRYVYANKSTLDLFNCSSDELVGNSDAKFFPVETAKRITEVDQRVLMHSQNTQEEIVSQSDDGSQKIYWEIKTPIYDDFEKKKISGLCGISTDITERKQLEKELLRQAHLDYLTGLANRRRFMEQGEIELKRALRYENRLSVFMLDIDHFKRINDTRGHKAGDLVLIALSKICQDLLREVDIIGRIGGEEFAVVLPETGLDEAAEVAERLRKKLHDAEVSLPEGLPLRFTVSIGVATLKSENVNIDMLLNDADKALYQAKKSGRNQICVAT